MSSPDPHELLSQALAQHIGEKANLQDDIGACYEALAGIPGTDPFAEDADMNTMPATGFLVTSQIRPGYAGTFTVHRFTDGGLSYQRGDCQAKLSGANGEHSVLYENPTFPTKTVEPYNRTGIGTYLPRGFSSLTAIPLENGGRILAGSGTFSSERPFTSHPSILFTDPREAQASGQRFVYLSRIVTDGDSLTAVLTGIARGMGLEESDTRTLVEHTADKCIGTKNRAARLVRLLSRIGGKD